jgi:hypothetical protein
MKPRSSFIALLIAFFAIPLTLRGQDLTPIIPTGSLSAFPTIVQAGTHPTLTWDVVLPERVSDVIEIEEPGTLVPTRCLIMDVRVLGASVKRVWTNSQGKITKWEWVPTEAKINYNGQGYTRIFYNTQKNVNPNTIVHSQVVEAGSTIDFGGRFALSSGAWSTWYSSSSSDYNVIALKNGDIPPTTTPLYQQPSVESFLLPYLDDEGKISLGARDVIYLMELTHTDRNHGGFDLQDMALLVSFFDEVAVNGATSDCSGATTNPPTTGTGGTATTTDGATGDVAYVAPDDTGTGGTIMTEGNGNNGHGNNADGVDSSNPGNAPFVDSDPSVDDEVRGRRKK